MHDISSGKQERGYRDIAGEMRGRVFRGAWPAQSRLPTKLDLCREFATSAATMQRALDVLSAEGFIETRGRAGTFVAAAPPHLATVGFALPGRPPVSRFWDALDREFRTVQHGATRRIRYYYNCAQRGADSDLPQLLDDLICHRIGGLVALGTQEFFDGMVDAAGRDIVVISIGEPVGTGHHVRLGEAQSRAATFLSQRGRRRVAVLAPYQSASNTARFLACARKAGLTSERRLVHEISSSSPHTARSIAELLMGLPRASRPDALYLPDDHLVMHATLGLHDAGAAVGAAGDLDVVAHCNFPYPEPTAVLVTRLGYDIRDVVRRSIALVDAGVARKAIARTVCVGPVFEDELPYSLSPAREELP